MCACVRGQGKVCTGPSSHGTLQSTILAGCSCLLLNHNHILTTTCPAEHAITSCHLCFTSINNAVTLGCLFALYLYPFLQSKLGLDALAGATQSSLIAARLGMGVSGGGMPADVPTTMRVLKEREKTRKDRIKSLQDEIRRKQVGGYDWASRVHEEHSILVLKIQRYVSWLSQVCQ